MPERALINRTAHHGAPVMPMKGSFPAWLGVLFLALALAGGITLKAASKGPTQIQEPSLHATIAPFLKQHGYKVTTGVDKDGLEVGAVGGFDCRLHVIQAQPRGYDQHAIRQAGGVTDDFFVVFDGDLYDAQPVWRTKAYYYWDRFRRKMGLTVPPRALFAVIASRTCSARQLPWQDLWDAHAS